MKRNYSGKLTDWLTAKEIAEVHACSLRSLKMLASRIANPRKALYDCMEVTFPDGHTAMMTRNNILNANPLLDDFEPDPLGWRTGLTYRMIRDCRMHGSPIAEDHAAGQTKGVRQ